MFYDAGLLVLPLAAMLAPAMCTCGGRRRVVVRRRRLDLAKDAVGLTPLFAVTIAVFVIALVNARRYEPLPRGVAT